jgi:hypothetical protein
VISPPCYIYIVNSVVGQIGRRPLASLNRSFTSPASTPRRATLASTLIVESRADCSGTESRESSLILCSKRAGLTKTSTIGYSSATGPSTPRILFEKDLKERVFRFLHILRKWLDDGGQRRTMADDVHLPNPTQPHPTQPHPTQIQKTLKGRAEKPGAETVSIAEPFALRIHARHPLRKCSREQVGKLLARILKRSSILDRGTDRELLARIDANHEAWAISEAWTKDNSQFCPGLERWLQPDNERYLEAPILKRAPSINSEPDQQQLNALAVKSADSELFEDFFGRAIAAGVSVNEHDREEALRLWLHYESAEHLLIIADYSSKLIDGTWSGPQFTPRPASYLEKKTWREPRKSIERILPMPKSAVSKKIVVATRRFLAGGQPE